MTSLTSLRKRAKLAMKYKPSQKNLKFPGIGWNNMKDIKNINYLTDYLRDELIKVYKQKFTLQELQGLITST